MKWLKRAVLGGYTLLIAYVSLSGDSSPDSMVPDLNSYGIPNLDKMAHTGAYGLFIIIAIECLHLTTVIPRLTSALLILFYGAVLECLQLLVPSREASIFDFMADVVGVLIGLGMITWWQRRNPPHQVTHAEPAPSRHQHETEHNHIRPE